MRIVVYDSPGKRAVTLLVQTSLEMGLRVHGDHAVPYKDQESIEAADAAVIIGISNEARDVVKQCRRAGKSFIIIDKGYTRRKSRGDIEHNAYWRTGINALHTEFPVYSDKPCPHERWESLGLSLGKIREHGRGGYVLVVGTAIRVFGFLGMAPVPGPTGSRVMEKYFDAVIRHILAVTPLPIRLRNKIATVPLSGSKFAKQRSDRVSPCPDGNTIEKDLSGAAVVVAHTTNAGVRAVMAGVPVVELGVGVVKPLAETNLSNTGNPRRYTEEERERFFRWLAWQQWTLAEIKSGEAWANLRPRLLG